MRFQLQQAAIAVMIYGLYHWLDGEVSRMLDKDSVAQVSYFIEIESELVARLIAV